jgi:predicted esterase
MSAQLRSLAILSFCLSIAGCGGGGGNDRRDPDPAPQSPAARGSLIESPPARTASLNASNLLGALTSLPFAQQLLELIAPPKCGIDIHNLRYNTIDPKNAPTTASAAMMIPTGSDPVCQGPRPILLFTHGTRVERSLNQANITDEDNLEALLAAVIFTTQGYVLVAPNYLGFDDSALPYHPYLNAAAEANDVVDALTAARSALPTRFAPTVTDSGKLFITGYSQGGHVAMATHRLLQQTGATLTASAPMSGPYALAAFADAVFFGQVTRTTPLFFTYTTVGYQRAYGNIYSRPTEIFTERYTGGIETLLPSAVPRTQLFAEGKLPRQQLFSSMPPDPSFAQFTPATTPTELADVFAAGFGADHLVPNSFRLAYLQDAQAHPDGGFPLVTDGRPAANPANTLRQAFKTNDLRNWVPIAPVFLCAGKEDPTVSYMNTQLMRDFWAANGATTNVRVLDLESSIEIDDPHAGRKLGFAAAKQAIAADGGRAAVIESYHSTLLPPFCLAAVKSFFDAR